MLLAHNSGMNSGADYRQLLGHNVTQYAIERDLVARPGERVIYSDLGFIAVGELLQRMYGRSLRALMRDVRATPAYRPSSRAARDIPATEDDGWRGRVQGLVHDEKAYLMGGIAGHAGLFGNASDVAWLAEQYLGPRNGRASRAVSADMAHEATREQAYDPVLRRGLGWALKTSDENSCGRYFSASTFGHTGFVGTCVWADPQRDCSGVLLTNSVYFGRSDTRDLRAAFYEALIEDLRLQ
jgi:CubicO group peptidase (beta-lactamase class C family)